MSRMSFQGRNFQSLYLVLCVGSLGRLENSIKRIFAVFRVTRQLNPLMSFCRNTILVVKIKTTKLNLTRVQFPESLQFEEKTDIQPR